MNKPLIQKLLDKSCYDNVEQQDLEDWCNAEKFAELIVKECIEIVEKDAPISAEYIRVQFGVE